MRRRNILIELGTEELPPKVLKKLGEAFSNKFYSGLQTAGLLSEASAYQFYATPRRLAVWVSGVAPRQLDGVEERKGPALQAAYDDKGQPTKAALGFARSCQVDVSELTVAETEKGAWLVFQKPVPGLGLSEVVGQCLGDSIKQLPIPKRMRWGDSNIEFVRPVHWLLGLYGSDILACEVLGLKASRMTMGHRFHANKFITIPSADRYASTLKTSGFVMVDYQIRKETIEKQILRLADKANARVVIDPKLLDLVTGLVEWPQAILGEFDPRFLKVPSEVLISSMSDHQKYFHLVDETGSLLPLFVTVSNIKSKSPKRVRQGNERVLRARLSDAEFFWLSDQKILLSERVDSLKNVLFHRKLGSIHDKSRRIELLADNIVKQFPGDAEGNRALVSRAAMLCKTDLVTDMVGEFPDLQGVVGRYYATNQGERKLVAQSIDDHYLPRFAGDNLPKDKVSQSLALADRIDTLLGIFGSGEIPTGDKDPYGLRRSALGVLRILIEKKLNLNVFQLLQVGLNNYQESLEKPFENYDVLCNQVLDFIFDRLKSYYQSQGFSNDEVAAVLACRPSTPLDFDHRLRALSKFFRKSKSAAQALAAANKRIANILNKSDHNKQVISTVQTVDTTLVQEGAEKRLFDHLARIDTEVNDYFDNTQYDKAFEALAALREPIDDFFDQVMVMDPNEKIRQNRFTMLRVLRTLFLGAADISLIRHEQ
ncbi:MAG: glycine--tRNA ligase subunit beta [Gammaproteobacteria bacterium]|nr:glycine--tRNA ligase subunit beta [Gammaproteobacteria bacterium]